MHWTHFNSVNCSDSCENSVTADISRLWLAPLIVTWHNTVFWLVNVNSNCVLIGWRRQLTLHHSAGCCIYIYFVVDGLLFSSSITHNCQNKPCMYKWEVEIVWNFCQIQTIVTLEQIDVNIWFPYVNKVRWTVIYDDKINTKNVKHKA